MTQYSCDMCGWVYDPAVGLRAEGVAAGTPFEALPEDFICPDCGAVKARFSPRD